MLYEKHSIFPVDLEQDGFLVDYVDGRFVMVLKDRSWSDFEIQALQRHRITVSFLYERVCALFLLEINDAIDTSDAAFDIHNCEHADKLLKQEEPYDIEIYLVDSRHKICAQRSITLPKVMCELMKEKLEIQAQTPYDEAGFDRALMKLQGTYEPFEMEPMAVCQASF
ncbi:MAG: hypothetical protein KH431_06040 [Erysipelotrichaceae bacterium]|nr:hypothetical protein [Erysipelotrichaceae bacterium]